MSGDPLFVAWRRCASKLFAECELAPRLEAGGNRLPGISNIAASTTADAAWRMATTPSPQANSRTRSVADGPQHKAGTNKR